MHAQFVGTSSFLRPVLQDRQDSASTFPTKTSICISCTGRRECQGKCLQSGCHSGSIKKVPRTLFSSCFFAVKSNTFVMMGLLVEYFPAAMHDQIAPIMNLALTNLMVQAKSDKPEMLVMAGILDCMTSLLTQCDEGDFPGGQCSIMTVCRLVSHCISRRRQFANLIRKHATREDSSSRFVFLSSLSANLIFVVSAIW